MDILPSQYFGQHQQFQLALQFRLGAKYLLKCNEEQMDFTPFVLDSFGRMGEEAWMLLNHLSYNISVHKAKRRLRGKIVIAMIQIKQQSAQIARRVRDGPKFAQYVS